MLTKILADIWRFWPFESLVVDSQGVAFDATRDTSPPFEDPNMHTPEASHCGIRRRGRTDTGAVQRSYEIRRRRPHRPSAAA